MTREELLKIGKPILFNTEMVKAILERRKACTRRVVKPRYKADEGGFQVCTNKATGERWVEKHDWDEGSFDNPRDVNLPYKIGDILYVRETWKEYEKRSSDGFSVDKHIAYKADENNPENPSEFYEGNWKPSIHMPKKVARIFLKVTDVRIERLQDIELQEIIDEGIWLGVDEPGTWGDSIRLWVDRFINIWEKTIKKKDLDIYGWKANPYVWVIEFERVDAE